MIRQLELSVGIDESVDVVSYPTLTELRLKCMWV